MAKDQGILTPENRAKIAAWQAQGMSIRQMAKNLGISHTGLRKAFMRDQNIPQPTSSTSSVPSNPQPMESIPQTPLQDPVIVPPPPQEHFVTPPSELPREPVDVISSPQPVVVPEVKAVEERQEPIQEEVRVEVPPAHGEQPRQEAPFGFYQSPQPSVEEKPVYPETKRVEVQPEEAKQEPEPAQTHTPHYEDASGSSLHSSHTHEKKEEEKLETPQNKDHQKKKGVPINKTYAMFICVILVLMGVIGYLGVQQNQRMTQNNSKVLGAMDQAQKVIEAVSRHAVLPSGETPAIATVDDVNKIREQNFFKNAENGDKILVFKEAKKAILYRPNIDKVVEMGPINLTPEVTPTINLSGTPSLTPTVVPTRIPYIPTTIPETAPDQTVPTTPPTQ